MPAPMPIDAAVSAMDRSIEFIAELENLGLEPEAVARLLMLNAAAFAVERGIVWRPLLDEVRAHIEDLAAVFDPATSDRLFDVVTTALPRSPKASSN